MKQHITSTQAAMLSGQALIKLHDWMTTHGYLHYGESLQHEKSLMTIGQMIEFLDYHDFEPIIERVDITATWVVESTTNPTHHQYQKTELCDALWEAVKEVLERS